MVIQDEPCLDTVSQVSTEFRNLSWELTQIQIFAKQARRSGLPCGPESIRTNFSGTRVLELASDEDIMAVAARGESSTERAKTILAGITPLAPSYIEKCGRPSVGKTKD